MSDTDALEQEVRFVSLAISRLVEEVKKSNGLTEEVHMGQHKEHVRKQRRYWFLAGAVIGLAVGLTVFLVSVSHAAKYDREYYPMRREHFATLQAYRAYQTLTRVKGLRGVPLDCRLTVVPGGNPENPYDLELCGLRILGTEE